MSGFDLLLQAAGRSQSDFSVGRSASNSSGDYKHSLLHSNFIGTNNKPLPSSKIPLSDSKISLPPKKRMKHSLHVASGEHNISTHSAQLRPNPISCVSVATFVSSASSSSVDSPTINSEWTDSATTEAKRPKNGPLQLCDTISVPKRKDAAHKFSHGRRSASKKKPNSSSDLKLRRGFSNHSINTKSGDTKSLTDVDGNDMCMGYFSMPRRKPPPAVLPTTVMNPQEEHQVEKLEQPVPTLIQQELTSNSAMESFPSGNKTRDEKSENSQAMTAKLLLYQAYLQAINQSPNNK